MTFLDTGHPSQFNRYSYTFNDPINNTDPDGRICLPCGLIPVIVGGGGAAGGTTATVGAGALAVTGGVATFGVLVVTDPLDGVFTSEGATRPLGDLEPIDAPGHNEPRPELQELTDDELMGTVTKPKDGQKVKVREGSKTPLDGNGRVKEMKDRGFSPDTEIPVDVIPDDPPDIFPELQE